MKTTSGLLTQVKYVYILISMYNDFVTRHSEDLMAAATSCACGNLRKAARAVSRRYDDALKPAGIGIGQYSMLVAIALYGSATISQLAQELVMDRTTLTRDLKLLQRDGLAQIVVGTDQRTRVVSLTAAGSAVLLRALPLWQEVQQQVMAQLGVVRWQTLHSNLGTVVSATRQP